MVTGHPWVKVRLILLACALSAVDSVFDTISVVMGHADEIDSQFNTSGEDRTDLSDRSFLSSNPELGTVCWQGGVGGGSGHYIGKAWVSPLLLSLPFVGDGVSVFGTNSVLLSGVAVGYGQLKWNAQCANGMGPVISPHLVSTEGITFGSIFPPDSTGIGSGVSFVSPS